MSAAHNTQPPVKPAAPGLEGIEESGRLPVAPQSSGPPDSKDNHPTVHVDITPVSPLVDVEAKGVLSSPLPLPFDNSSNPPDVISLLNDADANSIVLGASHSIDNVDVSSLEECFSRLLLDVDAGMSALSTSQFTAFALPKDTCNMKLTEVDPTKVRAARQTLAEMEPRLQSIAVQLKEIVLSVVRVFPDPAEASAAPGTSGPAPIPPEAMEVLGEIRHLILERLQVLAMKCYWLGMNMWWYGAHLPAIEGDLPAIGGNELE